MTPLEEMREAFLRMRTLAEEYRLSYLKTLRENEELRQELQDLRAFISHKFQEAA